MLRSFDNTSEDLWKQFLPGDPNALDAIVKKHYNLLYQYGCKFTRDTGLVKDCIQDLFLYLWQKRSSINETASVEHYLMKSLRRAQPRIFVANTPNSYAIPLRFGYVTEFITGLQLK